MQNNQQTQQNNNSTQTTPTSSSDKVELNIQNIEQQIKDSLLNDANYQKFIQALELAIQKVGG